MLSARDRDRRRRIVVGRKGCPTDAGASLGLPVFSPAIAAYEVRGAMCEAMAAPHTRYEVQESRSHRARAVCQRLSGATALRRVTNKTDASCKQNDEQKESSIYRVEPLADCTQST